MIFRYSFLLFLTASLLVSCGASKKSSGSNAGTASNPRTGSSSSTATPKLQPEPESKTGRIGNVGQYEKKLRSKYAAYIGISPQSIENIELYKFIDQWLYTPYKYSGLTKTGIDCSGFVQRLLADVYNIKIIRKSSASFYNQNTDRYNSRHDLNEGDVLFFRTGSDNSITHMGLYLGNRMFVHASTTYGVSIASLDNQYWKLRYAGAGSVVKNSR